MFIVLLRFSANRDRAGRLMEVHNAWVKRGFEDGVFVLAGGLKPNLGGVILARSTTLTDLQARVSRDPFVAEGVVSAELLEVAPSRADEHLGLLLD